MGIIFSLQLRLQKRFEQLNRRVKELLARPNKTPIFVLGNQKSGTTAIAALLAKRTGCSVTLDLTTHHSELVVGIYNNRKPIEALIDERGIEFSRDVIKDPNLTFLYPWLRERFPRGQFVQVVRDPRANFRSILDRHDIDGHRPNIDLEELKSKCSDYQGMWDAWKIILDGSWMGLEGKTHIDMLAARWVAAAKTYLGHSEDIELIRYEDSMSDKLKAVDDLIERLNLPIGNSVEDQVDTQFQPRGNH